MAMPPYSTPPARKRKLTPALIIGAILIVLACCGGAILVVSTNADPNRAAVLTPTGDPEFDSRVHSTFSPEPVVTATAAPAPASKVPSGDGKSKAAPAPAPIIEGDDIVQVGTDVPPGRYRAVEDVQSAGGLCYWNKSRDPEGSNIIDNGLPSGGRPSVTLKRGQWFTSQGCPAWRKQ